MRLPVIDTQRSTVAAAFEMVDLAMAQGVNYYDTAWGYHGGNSELVMGRALARHPREQFYLADKFPGYDLANMDKVEEIFETQLKKLRCGIFRLLPLSQRLRAEHRRLSRREVRHTQVSHGAEEERPHQAPRIFLARLARGDGALPRRLRRRHGVLPASAQLRRLDFPEGEGEGRADKPPRPANLGDGAAARRAARKPAPKRRPRCSAACRRSNGPTASCKACRASPSCSPARRAWSR